MSEKEDIVYSCIYINYLICLFIIPKENYPLAFLFILMAVAQLETDPQLILWENINICI